jgi:DNA-binding NtrC family response regulator
VHQKRPELPIILMTGHGGWVEARDLRRAGICEVLKKPLLSADLAKGLARNLGLRSRGYDREGCGFQM